VYSHKNNWFQHMYQLEIATCLPEEYVNCVVILIIVFVISVVYRVLIT